MLVSELCEISFFCLATNVARDHLKAQNVGPKYEEHL